MPKNLRAKLPNRRARKRPAQNTPEYWVEKINNAKTTSEKVKVLNNLYNYVGTNKHTKVALNIKKAKSINSKLTFVKEDLQSANAETINAQTELVNDVVSGKYVAERINNYYKTLTDMMDNITGETKLSKRISDLAEVLTDGQKERLFNDLPTIHQYYDDWKTSGGKKREKNVGATQYGMTITDIKNILQIYEDELTDEQIEKLKKIKKGDGEK